MDLATARKILGPDAIIGVSACNNGEAIKAIGGDANYLGLGPVFSTATKKDHKSVIGTTMVQHILHRLSAIVPCATPVVAIGGINISNVQRVMFQSTSSVKSLDGVAVVSSIIAAEDPQVAASTLKELITHVPTTMSLEARSTLNLRAAIGKVPEIVKDLAAKSPLCHNMTNLVVQNFAANVALSIGASPIMANYGEEASDLAKLGGALVVNMGTVTPEGLVDYEKAIKAYNEAGRPVLLDPVGAGATAVRRAAMKRLLSCGYYSVIKGNENEILTVLGESASQQKGVDSGTSTLSDTQKVAVVQKLAIKERNVVLMTGKTDYLSNGSRTLAIRNGDAYLSHITGSGCTLGTTVAAALAVHEGDKLVAALAGILMFEIASERAAKRSDVQGPGTFVPAFLDELFRIRLATQNNDVSWTATAKVDEISQDLKDM